MKAMSKPFDCVEMKNRIQAEQAAKYAGLTDEERFERIHHELMTSDDEVARWWRRVRSEKEKE